MQDKPVKIRTTQALTGSLPFECLLSAVLINLCCFIRSGAIFYNSCRASGDDSAGRHVFGNRAVGTYNAPISYRYSGKDNYVSTNPYVSANHNRFILTTLEPDGEIGVRKAVAGVGNMAVWCYKSVLPNSYRPVCVYYSTAPYEHIIGDVDVVIDRRINCGRAFELSVRIYDTFLAKPNLPSMNELNSVLKSTFSAYLYPCHIMQ